MMRRPRTSEPSNLHRWQHFGKPHFMRVCRAKLGLYGTWINANCSVFLGGVAEVSAKRQQSNKRRGVQRAGSMCAHTWVSWTKCIAASPGWWFTGWKKGSEQKAQVVHCASAGEYDFSQRAAGNTEAGQRMAQACCGLALHSRCFMGMIKKKNNNPVNSHHYRVECHWNSLKPIMCI